MQKLSHLYKYVTYISPSNATVLKELMDKIVEH